MARPLVRVFLVFPALLAACGGGGGSNAITLAIPSAAATDGFVTSTQFVDTGTPISAGDTDGSFQNVARGFVRFDLSGIPAAVTILSAELRLHQSAVIGAPYTTLGGVVVDHVDIGAALDSTDFGAVALQSGLGVLSNDSGIGLKTLNVTAQVRADLAAARSNADFRLRFPTGSDADGFDDYVQFNDGEDSFGNGVKPLLVVRYEAP